MEIRHQRESYKRLFETEVKLNTQLECECTRLREALDEAQSHTPPVPWDAEEASDKVRLDWLEGELDREKDAMKSWAVLPCSLFRANLPITRAAIDLAMGEHHDGKGDSNGR